MMKTAWTVLALAVLAGCGDDDDVAVDGARPDAALPDSARPDAALPDSALADAAPGRDGAPPLVVDHGLADAKGRTRYVFDSLNVPDRASENDFLGFDLDNDSRHFIDNKLGSILQLIAANSGAPVDAQARNDDAVLGGQIIHLAQLRSTSFGTEDDVVFQLFLGEDADANPGNNLGGAGTFTLAAVSPVNARQYGHLTTGVFSSVEPGTATVTLSLGVGGPLMFPLVAVQLRATVSPTGVTNARLGGGVTKAEMMANILPRWFQQLTQIVTTAPSSAEAMAIKNLFDTNRDGTMTQNEFDASNTVQTMLSPDVDLLDASGELGQDGIKESISLGLGFSAVPASF